jgi:hypothetical protein
MCETWSHHTWWLFRARVLVPPKSGCDMGRKDDDLFRHRNEWRGEKKAKGSLGRRWKGCLKAKDLDCKGNGPKPSISVSFIGRTEPPRCDSKTTGRHSFRIPHAHVPRTVDWQTGCPVALNDGVPYEEKHVEHRFAFCLKRYALSLRLHCPLPSRQSNWKEASSTSGNPPRKRSSESEKVIFYLGLSHQEEKKARKDTVQMFEGSTLNRVHTNYLRTSGLRAQYWSGVRRLAPRKGSKNRPRA